MLQTGPAQRARPATGRTVTAIRTAGGGNTAVLSPLSPPAVPLLQNQAPCPTWSAARPPGWMSSSPAGKGASAAARTPARLTGCGPARGYDCARAIPALRGPAVIRESLQGKCAGFASRFAAFAADVGVSAGAFMLTLAAISFGARVLTGKDITWN